MTFLHKKLVTENKKNIVGDKKKGRGEGDPPNQTRL